MKTLKFISIIFAFLAGLAVFCAVTVTGSGFLDLSNIVRTACMGLAILFGFLSAAAWRYSGPKEQ